jgi:hypothetical protein
MNLLFTSPSILVSENRKEYDRMHAEAGGNVAVAERRLFESVDDEGSQDMEKSGPGGQGMEEEGANIYAEDKVSDSENSRF